jgi:hypothetical protein
MTIVFYISGHGWGHASRSLELLNAIGRQAPAARVVVRTAVDRRLFSSAGPNVDVQTIETDTGIVQIDSLRLDEDATARRAAVFYGDFDSRVAAEAALLRRVKAAMVVGDIPPLAFAAAAHAGVPSVAVGNFTWDWIYDSYPAFARFAPDVLPLIRGAYESTTLALRLPLHGGFAPMAGALRDIPFIARRSDRDVGDTRRLMGIAGDRPVALASFGGHGLDLPYRQIGRASGLTVLAPSDGLPDGLRYEDLVAAADVVVSKPGYGIVSECVANQTPLLYAPRGRFVEYDMLVAEMPRVLRCRYISREDLLEGRWADAVAALLAQPAPPDRPRVDGADVAAREIMNLAIV